MGRRRGRGRNVTNSESHEDNKGSSGEEVVPARKRRGRPQKLELEMAASMSNTNSKGGAQPQIDLRLIEAASLGDSISMMELAEQNPSILLGTTPQGNTCLHISSIHGHERLSNDVLTLNQSLLSATNSNGETPLLTSVTSGHALLASVLLGHCHDLGLKEAILKQDQDGCNVLHHAIHSGHKDLALELIATEATLSQGVNNYDESPMFIAVMRDFTDVFIELGIDVTVEDKRGALAGWALGADNAKTLNWTPDGRRARAAAQRTRKAGAAPPPFPCVRAAVPGRRPPGARARPPMATSMSSTDSTGGAKTLIDLRILEAARKGDSRSMMELAAQNPSILVGTTPQGNTCLHISSIHGHERFCNDVLTLNQSLLSATNSNGETPMLTSVKSGHALLASALLWHYHDPGLKEAILKQDEDGCNVLHHAIRSGHKDLALELIAAEATLSQGVNNYDESPMFMAAMRGFTDVVRKLLEIPGSAHVGGCGRNALHAAVRNGNPVIAKELMETRPWLAREENKRKNTPMHLAAFWGKTDVLRVLLQHDWSLGYAVTSDGGIPLLNSAAHRGNVGVARELLDHCPDVPCCDSKSWTCLHEAVCKGHAEFVAFILESPYLRKLINMRDCDGKTALHHAVQKCDTKIIAALLSHRGIDVTVQDKFGDSTVRWLGTANAKTLNWNEVSMLLLEADPQNATCLYNLHKEAKQELIDSSRKDAKSLTQTYTSNTSLIAILLATITFAAAFTLPGGYSNDAGNEGRPVMEKKIVFRSFLIADTLAMCSSLAVAFICIIARWEDFEFLLHYRSFTKKLMWFAYMATTMAFATGLYTVLTPRLLWLCISS
ncbi:hypothetical protein ABZP36_008488 [Zizania latifolia]